jgi:shikimate dehydrogenase
MTDRYAVLGHPVEHSRSPFIHAAFARQTGEHIAYDRLPLPLDGFDAGVRAFAASGAKGCNVTVPFKFEAARIAGRLSDRARLAGAVNTLRFDGPEPAAWQADNTDGVGLLRDLQHNAGCPVQGLRVLLIGAGGSAAGVLGSLLAAAPAEVVIANRTPAKAEALVAAHAALADAHGVVLSASALHDCGRGFALVINGTASSLAGDAVPVAPEVLAPGALAVDLMYGPAAAGFLDWASGHGARGRDGLGMLVEQAAEAFALWRGVRPDTAPVLAALRAEVGA